MRLPPNSDSIRDYLEWSYRRADMLLAAWEFRKRSRGKGKYNIEYSNQAKVQYALAMNFKKELNLILKELKGS